MIINIKVINILESFTFPYKILGNINNLEINNIKPILEADEFSFCWINPKRREKNEYAANTKSRFIVCDDTVKITEEMLINKCFLIVQNPKLIFLRIVEKYFINETKHTIHPKSEIDKDAKIGNNVLIGAFTYIGKCEIGEGTKIYGNCYLYDNVKVGKNVTIHAGTVIGADGFGYQRNENGQMEKFPHIGGVIIEDNVDIGANTCIDKGALGNTLIKEGAKIDNLVHIAHNVVVGKDAVVIANSMIGGSTIIGDRAWVAPSVSLMNSIEIGENTTIGLGGVVIKSIPANEVWVGFPAKPIKEYLSIQNKLKKL
ncbi:MAG: UDP-3-O-(3-hydroxymyristoyl)glucosamine N-acyltransferase [bacterium]